MPNKDLKPCPFCGKNEQERFSDDDNTYVRCGWCGALGPESSGYEAAKVAWNERVA